MSTAKLESVEKLIAPAYTDKGITNPHCIMELSLRDYSRIQMNTIHLSGYNVKTFNNLTQATYNIIKYGDNVKTMKKKSKIDGEQTVYSKDIKLAEMKGKYLFITGDKKDYMHDPNIFCIDTTTRCDCNNGNDGKYKPSGVVVLCIITLNYQKNKTGWSWGKQHYDLVRKSKHDLMGGSASHFGSEGKYYSFGNKGNYGMKNDSSVGQYTNRQYKDASKMLMSNVNAIGLEEMVARELEAGIEGIAKIAPNIRNLIAPVINVAYREQLKKGDINLNKGASFDSGLWQSNISVNARTASFHTENGSTYTFISIPKQEVNCQRKHEYSFLFSIKDKINISITLTEGISFIFSGKLLTHRQSCNFPVDMKGETFINFSSYGTKRLFSHIKKSFMRLDKK